MRWRWGRRWQFERLAGLHGGLEIGQMILQRGDASIKRAIAIGEVDHPFFERNDALGIGDAHGSNFTASSC
jgi:hypothetical protein